MAVTITNPTFPLGFLPSNSDIIYSIASDQTYQSNFYYIIDVLIDNASVIQLRIAPVDQLTPVKLNVKDIVKNFVSSTFITGNMAGLRGFYTAPELREVIISVTEWYNGEDWTTTNSNPLYVWNAVAQFKDLKNGVDKFYRNFVPYTNVSVTTIGRPLAYHNVVPFRSPFRQSGRKVYLGTMDFPRYIAHKGMNPSISFFTYSDSYSPNVFGTYFVFAGFDEKGKMIKKFIETTGADSSINKRICVTPSGIDKINGSNFTYRYGADTSTMMDCKYVMFYVTNNVNFDYTTADTKFNLYPILFEVADCNEAFGILYKSNEGGWGFVSCNHTATEETSVETTTRLNAPPTTWNNSSKLISAVDIKAQGKITLNSGWVNSGIQQDIQDMITSPVIYIQHYKDGTLDYIPVTLQNATYITNESRNVNLRNYEFSFVESYYKNTIRE